MFCSGERQDNQVSYSGSPTSLQNGIVRVLRVSLMLFRNFKPFGAMLATLWGTAERMCDAELTLVKSSSKDQCIITTARMSATRSFLPYNHARSLSYSYVSTNSYKSMITTVGWL